MMTKEREEARQQAAETLERASQLRERGIRIAMAWRQSQQDNNFRQMLRQLGKAAEHESH